ncbi:hypothetical protein ACZ11_24030 [Lysinibacillus xylanilyticus]|uniref:Uncharacterized protein n=1 Tax=Lysinibacillus xylanilyticus TaxID=582475 RepID=A0A0K9F140_9BACI|nr:hypothetical protein [Lysinibacillus xylanilyticus]KMY28299.1 hypothetical protein ACZ11_24030 [Lysinibacillus xylanilyticus]
MKKIQEVLFFINSRETQIEFNSYNINSNPETVEIIKLSYGQYRSDFEIENTWKVDLEIGQILIEYPTFETPLTEPVKHLL